MCVLEYITGKKGFHLYDIESESFFISRDVKFFEDIFPFLSTSNSTKTPIPFPSSDISLPSGDLQLSSQIPTPPDTLPNPSNMPSFAPPPVLRRG